MLFLLAVPITQILSWKGQCSSQVDLKRQTLKQMIVADMVQKMLSDISGKLQICYKCKLWGHVTLTLIWHQLAMNKSVKFKTPVKILNSTPHWYQQGNKCRKERQRWGKRGHTVILIGSNNCSSKIIWWPFSLVLNAPRAENWHFKKIKHLKNPHTASLFWLSFSVVC